jgi:hypothetical protein
MATTASHTLTNQAPISTHLTRWILGLTIMACITPCNTWTGNPSADPSSVATAIVIASYNICCNWKELSSLIEKAKEKPWDIVLIQEVGLLEDHNVNTINKAADEAGSGVASSHTPWTAWGTNHGGILRNAVSVTNTTGS